MISVVAASINVAELAPRDIASSPNAPVPAKISSTALTSEKFISPLNTLNNDSLTRSLVGLVESPAGVFNRKPFARPVMIRIIFFPKV